jgi:CheY-like chemotaxis protein
MRALDILVIDDDIEGFDAEDPRQTWFAKSLARLGHTVTAAHSSSDAYRFLRERQFDLAFFDHDLGEPTTGSTIAGQILYQPEEYQCPRAVWVHSHNPVGAANIESKFKSAGVPTRVLDYSTLKGTPPEVLDELISELVPQVGPASSSELVALIDMDSSLVDYEGRLRERLLEIMSPLEENWFVEHEAELLSNPPTWLKARERLIKHQTGFWFDLPVIPFGIELYRLFGELGFKRVILTKGPHKNPAAWAEKTRWCEQHVPEAGITITHDKGLIYGRVLYDDWPEYILRWLKWRPRGKVLMLDAVYNRHFQHPNVLRCSRAPMHTQKELIQRFLGM